MMTCYEKLFPLSEDASKQNKKREREGILFNFLWEGILYSGYG